MFLTRINPDKESEVKEKILYNSIAASLNEDKLIERLVNLYKYNDCYPSEIEKKKESEVMRYEDSFHSKLI